MTILNIGFTAHPVGCDAAEAVPDEQRSVGRYGDVIVHGKGRVPAVKPFLFLIRIDRADAHTVATLLHVDLDLLRVSLRFIVRASLHADGGGDFDLASGFAVYADFPKLVFDLERLARAKRQRFLKITRDLVFTGARGRHLRYRKCR